MAEPSLINCSKINLLLFIILVNLCLCFCLLTTSDRFRTVFLKKQQNEPKNDLKSEIPAKIYNETLTHMKDDTHNQEEETQKGEKNVLDKLKVVLKKVKHEVAEEDSSRSKISPELAEPKSKEEIVPSSLSMEVSSNLQSSEDKNEIASKHSNENQIVESSQTVSSQSKLDYRKDIVNKSGSIEHVPKIDAASKSEVISEIKQTKNEDFSEVADPMPMKNGGDPQLTSTSHPETFVERTVPWVTPESLPNVSRIVVPGKDAVSGTPDERVASPEGEMDALGVKKEEGESTPVNETTSPAVDNATVTNEVDVNGTSSSSPQQEVQDGTPKDQLETYSQFAERVTAEKKNGAGSANGHATNGQVAIKPPKVKSKNYASMDCGAKFLAANPESSYSHKVINSNKDEYMLNKCTGKIWAVVELCESIRPHKFDIANFELFSNSPKDIYLFGSHRYPTREWTALGAYEGEEGNRNVQSFFVETEEFFKYVKLEVHSYYGTEFFCPLSLFRVYGLSEFEIIEDTDDNDEEQMEEETIHETKQEDTKDKSGMIPDVIKSVVSGVLEVIKRGSRSNNRTEEPELKSLTQNCRSLHENFSIPKEVCPFADSLNYILACYYNEYLKLMTNPFIASVVQNRDFCRLLATVVCATPETDDRLVYDSVCNNSYACVMLSPKHILAMCHMHDTTGLRDRMACSSQEDEQPLPSPNNISTTQADFVNKEHQNVPLVTPDVTEMGATDPHHSSLSDSTKIKEIPNSPTPTLTPSPDADQKDAAEVIHLPHVDSKLKPTKTTPKKNKETLEVPPSETTPTNGTATTTPLPAGSIPEKTTSESSSEKNGDKGIAHEKQTLSDEVNPPSVLPPQGVAPTTAAPPSVPSENRAVSHTNKESVVVRLSNKIKVLENNMSISSQYLEELSRTYKRQMEDMQRQFNITILALNSTSQTAYERDLYHQKRLESLENQVEGLTKVITALAEEKESLITRVVEQHMILLFVELTVMFLVFSFCIRRKREDAGQTSTSSVFWCKKTNGSTRGRKEGSLRRGEADQQGRETPSLCRRRSVDSIRCESEAKPRQRRLSGDLSVTGSYKDLLISESSTTKERQKKKKKKGRLERSLSNASITDSNRSSANIKKEKKLEKLRRSSAGVLFSGEKNFRANEMAAEDWYVVRKSSKGKNKGVEAQAPSYEEEPYPLASDLKRSKIILDEELVNTYQHHYYTEMPFDHGSGYERILVEDEYKDLYDYNNAIEAPFITDVYPHDLDYNAPVIANYHYAIAEESAKPKRVFVDDVDSAYEEQRRSDKFLTKARSCTDFRSPGERSSTFKGRTKLRSDNWEWYSSQPSRLVTQNGGTSFASEVISNSSSDSSVKSKQQIVSKNFYEKHTSEKKKKKKGKWPKLTNGDHR